LQVTNIATKQSTEENSLLLMYNKDIFEYDFVKIHNEWMGTKCTKRRGRQEMWTGCTERLWLALLHRWHDD